MPKAEDAGSDDLPTQEELVLPLLRVINASGRGIRPPEAVAWLADEFRLTEEQRERLNPSRTNNMFYNRVNWARLRFVKDGLVSDEQYGVWVITDAGRKELRSRGFM
jgi:restriction system protein